MPKVVNHESEPSTGRRKSTRAKKMVNHSLLDEFSEDVVKSMGADKEVEMPPGFNREDDSEDDHEYTPMAKKGRRKDDSDFDSEEESKTKKSRKSTTGRKPKYQSTLNYIPRPNPTSTSQSTPTLPKIKPEPGQEETLACVVCKETLKVDTNAKFHYSVHYYDANAFLHLLKPEDLKDGRAQDEVGRVFKYTCPHEGCTRRKMGYKEICVHLATAHQQLRQLMIADTRPGMKEVLDRLYPQEAVSFLLSK